MTYTPAVATTVVVIIGGNDVSDHCTKAEFVQQSEALDTTTFGTGYKTVTGGLKSGTLNVSFNNDFSAANLDSIMEGFIGSNQTFVVRPSNAATSTSNPAYTGTIFIGEWQPISGQVGQLMSNDRSFQTSGQWSRVTS